MKKIVVREGGLGRFLYRYSILLDYTERLKKYEPKYLALENTALLVFSGLPAVNLDYNNSSN